MPGATQGEQGESTRIVLGLLESVERDGAKSQRRLAADLGIALGLVNAYLKRCVKKGLVKVSEAPMRRYAYYLTPQGFSEKARLTGEYLAWSLEFFRKARREATELFAAARTRGLRHFILVGGGDLAEVVVLSAIDTDTEIIGVLDPDGTGARCAGKKVFHSLGELTRHVAQSAQTVDAIMVTSSQLPVEAFALARVAAAELGVPLTRDHILLPSMLKISWGLHGPAEETAG